MSRTADRPSGSGRADVSELITLLETSFARLTSKEAIEEADRIYRADAPGWIAVQNVHGVNLAHADPSYRAAVARANLVLNDGKGVMLGARLTGSRFPEDLNGNHFTPLLLRHAATAGWPTFFLGAQPGVAERAARTVAREIPGLAISGCHHGYLSDPEELTKALEAIRSSGARLLLVGMGNPSQEMWLDQHMIDTGVRLGIGVGAFFDFKAGEVKRAPAWMNRMGLEWLHRLAKEPRRMWRRYLLGNPLFLWRILSNHVRSR